MDLSILLPLAVAFIGLVVYVIAGNPKAIEAGRLAYATGLLATLLHLAGHALKISA